MGRYSIILFLVAGLFFSCSKDTEVVYAEGTLGRYIADMGLPVQRDSLIACAASGQQGGLQNSSSFNVSVFFYPPAGASDFRYYELASPKPSNNQLEDFTYIEHEQLPVFNGYLRRFIGDISDKACLVTFIKNGKLFISDPINLKEQNQPTDYNPAGTSITDAASLSPSFSWNTSTSGTDKIYFQAIVDSNGNLISGTYTEDTNWTFYDLSDVVLNIKDVNPAPSLSTNQTYKFIVMSVSDDNWVNTLIEQEFRTE